jgi:hypothetical protein
MSIAQLTITPEQQAIFALGEFAGLSSSVTGDDADHATLQAISTALKNAAGTIGAWNVVWGPSVVQQPVGKAYAMNTMYVAQNAATSSQYAIAIAGTNPRSILDWIVEDGFVHWQVPWIYACGRTSTPSPMRHTITGDNRRRSGGQLCRSMLPRGKSPLGMENIRCGSQDR